MKKLISFMLVLAMVFSMVACGKSNEEAPIKQDIDKSSSESYIGVWKSKPSGKMIFYFEKGGIGYYEFTTDEGVKYPFTYEIKDDVAVMVVSGNANYTVTFELNDEGDMLTHLGGALPKTIPEDKTFNKIDLSELENDVEEEFVLNEDELQEMINTFGTKAGHITWEEGSFPYFIEHKDDFERLNSDTITQAIVGEWTVTSYMLDTYNFSIRDDGTLTNKVDNEKEYIWEWSFDTQLHLGKSLECSAYKVTDDVLVLYDVYSKPKYLFVRK